MLEEAAGNAAGNVQLSYGAVARNRQGSLVSLQLDVELTNAGALPLDDVVLVLEETSPRRQSVRRLAVGRAAPGETVPVRAGSIVYDAREEPPRLRWRVEYRDRGGKRAVRDVQVTTGRRGP